MGNEKILIRPAKREELDAINRVIEAAVMSWKLPQRVKRLSLPSYRYDLTDLAALDVVVAIVHGQIVGVAAWESADPKETSGDATALLLHGIYVDPRSHHQGIGSRLFQAAEGALPLLGADGLLVKAQASADGFFLSRGMHRLQAEDPARQYANRFWKEASHLSR